MRHQRTFTDLFHSFPAHSRRAGYRALVPLRDWQILERSLIYRSLINARHGKRLPTVAPVLVGFLSRFLGSALLLFEPDCGEAVMVHRGWPAPTLPIHSRARGPALSQQRIRWVETVGQSREKRTHVFLTDGALSPSGRRARQLLLSPRLQQLWRLLTLVPCGANRNAPEVSLSL
jgi:hypothetical protein